MTASPPASGRPKKAPVSRIQSAANTAKSMAPPALKESFGTIFERVVKVQPTDQYQLGIFFGQSLWDNKNEFKTPRYQSLAFDVRVRRSRPVPAQCRPRSS